MVMGVVDWLTAVFKVLARVVSARTHWQRIFTPNTCIYLRYLYWQRRILLYHSNQLRTASTLVCFLSYVTIVNSGSRGRQLIANIKTCSHHNIDTFKVWGHNTTVHSIARRTLEVWSYYKPFDSYWSADSNSAVHILIPPLYAKLKHLTHILTREIHTSSSSKPQLKHSKPTKTNTSKSKPFLLFQSPLNCSISPSSCSDYIYSHTKRAIHSTRSILLRILWNSKHSFFTLQWST